MLQVLNWVMSAAAFVGTIFNSRRNKVSQCIWVITNVYMSWLNFYMGIPSIGTLYIAYTLLAIYGIYEWTRQERQEK